MRGQPTKSKVIGDPTREAINRQSHKAINPQSWDEPPECATGLRLLRAEQKIKELEGLLKESRKHGAELAEKLGKSHAGMQRVGWEMEKIVEANVMLCESNLKYAEVTKDMYDTIAKFGLVNEQQSEVLKNLLESQLRIKIEIIDHEFKISKKTD